jgi:protein-disulfide isomerase
VKLGLDIEQFDADLDRHVYSSRIAEDIRGADLSGVTGTPTFFVNGRRHHGPDDIAALGARIRAARARASGS